MDRDYGNDIAYPMECWPIKWRNGYNVWPIAILALLSFAGAVGYFGSLWLWYGQFSFPIDSGSGQPIVLGLAALIAGAVIASVSTFCYFLPDLLEMIGGYEEYARQRRHLELKQEQTLAEAGGEVGKLVGGFAVARLKGLCPIVKLR